MMEKKYELKIYEGNKGEIEISFDFEQETVWISSYKIADIYGRDRSNIQRHIKNIYSTGEMDEEGTCVKNTQVQQEGNRRVKRETNLYNLDVILAVGYRVNSQQATAFRKWATSVLKKYLLDGYALNQKRLQEKGLKEFESAVALIKKNLNNHLSIQETQGMLSIITQYAESRLLLQKYDEGELKLTQQSTKKSQSFSYEEACAAIEAIKQTLQSKGEVSSTFGEERNDGLKGVIAQIYQSFDGTELYQSIEEKAAALLYFTIKNHPFIDGNKKIGALLFVIFLAKNKLLYTSSGTKRIDDATLTALTLLIASSEASEKEMLLKLTANFLLDHPYEKTA